MLAAQQERGTGGGSSPQGTTAPAAQLACGALHCGTWDVPEKHKTRGWSLGQKGSWLPQPEAISPECSSLGHDWSDTQGRKPSHLPQDRTDCPLPTNEQPWVRLCIEDGPESPHVTRSFSKTEPWYMHHQVTNGLVNLGTHSTYQQELLFVPNLTGYLISSWDTQGQ